MEIVADLHVHSKYSRAVSQQMVLPVMAEYAKIKGIKLLSTGDITHPLWFKEISSQLEESSDGIYKLKDELINDKNKDIQFILSTEISSIYKQGDKVRRIHNLIFAPKLETVSKINAELIKRGCNLHSDGRPIIGLTSHDLLELILTIDDRCFLIPCHVWTPHFGLYGSASGFNSIKEAFADLTPYIYGVETGLSSDPDMNWSIEDLKNLSIISNSDAHSPAKMGREATVFVLNNQNKNEQVDKEKFNLSYEEIRLAIKREKNARLKIGYTVELYPEEGKYHFSGHRNCKVSYGPNDINIKGIVCPVCRKKLTEGVLVRVQQMANNNLNNRVKIKSNDQGLVWHIDQNSKQPPYVKLVPLIEIIAESMRSTVASQKVKDVYTKLCLNIGSELVILLKCDISKINEFGNDRIAEGVSRVRAGNLEIIPGFDGEYGKVKIWRDEESKMIKATIANQSQLSLDF